MFPHDVVANAPRIISDLRTFFPPQEGTFLIGPMAKLGWGTPTLVTPLARRHHRDPRQHRDPRRAEGRAARRGRGADRPAGQLHRRHRVRQEAASASSPSLFDSRVLLHHDRGRDGRAGRLRRRRRTSCSASAASIRVQRRRRCRSRSPSGSPSDILNNPLRGSAVEGYFAVTSNTVQFGARAELFFGFERAQRRGSPRLRRAVPVLAASTSSSRSRRRSRSRSSASGCSASRLQLDAVEGPTPWHAKGTGSISLLLLRHRRRLRRHLGRERATPRCRRSTSCRCSRPSSTSPRTGARCCRRATTCWSRCARSIAADGTLVLHPVGTLRVSQRAVPLGPHARQGRQPEARRRQAASTLGVDHRRPRARAATSRSRSRRRSSRSSATPRSCPRPPIEDMHGGIELSVSRRPADASGPHGQAGRPLRADHHRHAASAHACSASSRFAGPLFDHFLGRQRGRAVDAVAGRAGRSCSPFEDKIAVSRRRLRRGHHGRQHDVAGRRVRQRGGGRRTPRAAGQRADPVSPSTLHVIPAFEAAA